MNVVGHYLKRMHRHAGIRLYLNLLGTVAGSLLESVGVLLLVPLLGIIGLVRLELGADFLEQFHQWLGGMPMAAALSLVLGIYIAASLTQFALQRTVEIQGVRINGQFARKLRLDVYRKLLEADWPYFLRKRSSDLINTLTVELARVISAVNISLQLAASIIFTVIQIAVALWLSPVLTLFVLVCGALLGLASRRFIRRSQALGSQTSLHAQSYLAGITDQINGMKDIKSNAMERERLTWLNELSGRMLQEQLAYIHNRSNSRLLYKSASAVLIAVFIFAGFLLFRTQGAELLVITVIFARLWPRFTSIQSSLEQLASTAPACKALQDMENECSEAAERLHRAADAGADTPPLAVRHGIECRNLTFRYNKDEETPTLRHIDLNIPANSTAAIVGASGAGKSTLVDLIMGLLRPDEGEIAVDGATVSERNLLAYRKSIGYVPQDPFLFNASIRDNIRLALPDASDAQIWEALHFASCAEVVQGLPEGLDTVIGDRGMRLSGGERQRLVLARAMIRKPAILVLDEATSALDAENESNIQEAIDRLKGTMTIIIIAHRLSTLRGADNVFVLRQGELAEQGDWSRLAADESSIFGKSIQLQNRAVSF